MAQKYGLQPANTVVPQTAKDGGTQHVTKETRIAGSGTLQPGNTNVSRVSTQPAEEPTHWSWNFIENQVATDGLCTNNSTSRSATAVATTVSSILGRLDVVLL